MKTNKLQSLISVLFLSSILAILSTAHASTSKVYHLKGEAPVGSKIPTIEAVSPISFSKRFASLSNEEKAVFKAKYEEIGVNDTPPFPSMGLRAIYKPVIKANKELNATGSLHLTATINANGFVESVKVIESPSVELTASAERILRSTQFDPASCNGVACEMTFPIEITFK